MHDIFNEDVDTSFNTEDDDKGEMKSFKSGRTDNTDENDDTYYYCQKICSGREHMSILASIFV